jgi:hypothetical protein
MLELYAFLTLMSAGYILSNKALQGTTASSAAAPRRADRVHPSEIPSANTVYDADYYHTVRQRENFRAHRHHAKSKYPKQTGVIHNEYRASLPNPHVKTVRSELADVEMNVRDFRHNNMTPFFGSRIKQNLSATANRSILENFTGSVEEDMYRTKKEVRPMFKPNAQDVYGTRVQVDKHLDRFASSRIRNNEKPFDAVYVGPGLNQDGYGSRAYGGFHQVENEFYMPKSVDELRPLTNPKETFEGRVIQGAGLSQRGRIGQMDRNRQSLLEERNGERLFVTAGGNEAARALPEHMDLRDTERETTSQFYMGDARGSTNAATATYGQSKESVRQQLEDFGMRNVDADYSGAADAYDHGKGSIRVPDQERDLTGIKTYEGNLTSLVKAIVAPLEDMMKLSKKEFTAASARPYGELQSTAPPKLTIKDPNDVARTTIKETNIHDTREGYLTGPRKLTVYDPKDVARRTVRETTDDVHHPNLKGGSKQAERSDEKARTTMRETTLDGDNLGGPAVVDPRGAYATAKVEVPNTQKEFLSDMDYFGIAMGEEQPMSQDKYLNASMNELREGTLEGRTPSTQGTKEGVDVETHGTFNVTKLASSESEYVSNIEKVTNVPPDACSVRLTKSRDDRFECSDRLDTTLLSGLASNPYAMKPLFETA